MIKALLSTLCILYLVSITNATHLMGGEITWACQGDGRYVFTMKLYRDCNGVPVQTPVALRVHNHPTLLNIPLSLVSIRDISPQCNGTGPTISCPSTPNTSLPPQNPINGAVEEFIFRSNAINLPGVPPPQGWVFTYDDCCRNGAITNIQVNPTQTGFTLRAIMYANQGQNAQPCFDSSPVFAQLPATIICAGNPFTYNHNAYDPDLDSLVYSFAEPLDWLQGTGFTATNPLSIPYWPNYSVNSPFPGPAFNPNNVPATINNSTGEIAFTPFTTGNFITVVKVSSFRCGVLIAEIFREIQVVVLSCGPNTPPDVNPPFQDPITGLFTSFTDTVMAGDLVNFSISASDFEFLPIGFAQTISVNASGGQFGTNFTNELSGCENPPCATLTPPPPTTIGNNQPINFSWQTTCDHISYSDNCLVRDNVHTFVLQFQDDYCPAPSYNITTITIVVQAQPLMPSPEARCTRVLPNGDVQITWVVPPDPNQVFNSYHIFVSNNSTGPWTVVDSIFNYNQDNYTHSGAAADQQTRYYQIRTRSGCGGVLFSPAANTIQTIFLTVADGGAGNINLNWNPVTTPLLPTSAGLYEVFKKVGDQAFSSFTTTQNVNAQDFIVGCLQDLSYRIEIPDAYGCTSVSNVAGGEFSNDLPPESPIIDSVSIVNNQVVVSWQTSTSQDTKGYLVYEVIGGQNIEIANVQNPGPFNLSFVSPNQNSGSVSVNVAPYDSCGNTGNNSITHTTVFLTYDLRSCENRVNLNWTAYQGWGNGVNQYLVLRSENSGVFQQVGAVDGNTLIFSDFNLNSASNYCYAIRALRNGGGASSTSNAVCFFADVQQLPDFNYLRFATVDLNNRVRIRGFYDNNADLLKYFVLRAEGNNMNFDTIFQDYLNLTQAFINYTDAVVLTDQKRYTYKIALMDACKEIVNVSNIGQTILLRGEASDGFRNFLSWNLYEDWDADVEKYILHRSLDSGITYSPLIEFGPSVNQYFDPVIDATEDVLRFCYRVQAIENNGNAFGFKDTSWSNAVCVVQEPTIYIPNAFRPDEPFNNQFKPVGTFKNVLKSYEFLIFNRWGELLYGTRNPEDAWDGRFKNAVVPSGMYVYQVKFITTENKEFIRRGYVMALD